jgi:hypothetical protein
MLALMIYFNASIFLFSRKYIKGVKQSMGWIALILFLAVLYVLYSTYQKSVDNQFSNVPTEDTTEENGEDE